MSARVPSPHSGGEDMNRIESTAGKRWKAIVLAGVALTVLLALAPPPALADTFALTVNNLGIVGSVGTVTLTQLTFGGVNTGVEINVTMGSAFSLKLQDGNDVGFNSTTSIAQSNIPNVTFTVNSGL